jgi:hypothetical protein
MELLKAANPLDSFSRFEDEEHDFFLADDGDFFSLIGADLNQKEMYKPPKSGVSILPTSSEKSFGSTSSQDLTTSKNADLFAEFENQLAGEEKGDNFMQGKQDKELETNNEKLDPNEKSIVKGKKPFLMCIFGKPGEGKSALAQYVVYEKFQQKAVDYVMVISNSSFNDDWKWLPPKAIKKLWTKELAQQITDFQTKKGRGHLLVVLEDPVGSFPWEDKQVIQMIIMHRHLNISWIINVQYVYKLPPIYRECATYVAIFKQQTDRAKEALYLSYGGDFSSKQEFYKLLNESTGNYYFLFFEAPFQRWSKTKIEPLKKGAKINF